MNLRECELFFYIYSVEKFTLKEAVALIGNGAKYRAVEYYKSIYVNDVEKIGGLYYVTQAFIDKVKKNREALGKNTTDSRTKADLLKEIEKLKKGNGIQGSQELIKEIAELKAIISDYENSEVFEKSSDGFRVEVFSQDEYTIFSERLIEWRIQRKELETKNVHFESLKDERDFIKLQLEYFKSSNDKILLQHQNLIEIIGQRNRIEAVEKGAIPREPKDI